METGNMHHVIAKSNALSATALLSLIYLIYQINSSFPLFWMDNGKISTLNDKYADYNPNENSDEFAGEDGFQG